MAFVGLLSYSQNGSTLAVIKPRSLSTWDNNEGPSMMTVTSRVIIIICWLALMLLAVEYPRDHWIFRTAVLAVIGVVLLAEWWRWKQKVK